MADAQHLPQGRHQAGDRHLNFHETRDNLSLTRPFSRPTPGTQLIIGIASLAAGLLQMTFGPQILATITEFLGATANSGILLVEVLARVIGLTALPVGIALLAIQPLVRLAQTRQAHSLPAGPPDIETLD